MSDATEVIQGRESRVYVVAATLSIVSAVLGLAREFLILHYFGFSRQNDQLQYYLSIVYTISLMGDAVRLATLNLLQRAHIQQLMTTTLLTAVVVAGAVTAAYAWRAAQVDAGLLLASAAAGACNLVVVALVVDRQRHASFLKTHAVSLLPNYVIIAGIVVIHATTSLSLTSTIVALFLASPLAQMVGLVMLRAKRDGAAGGLVPLRDGMQRVGSHAMSSVGAQAGQIVIRTLLPSAGPGLLTVFALLVRIADTVRSVFIDSFIGSRVAAWATGVRRIPRLLDQQHLPRTAIVAILLVTTAVSMPRVDSLMAFGVQVAVLLAVGLYLGSLMRVAYYYLNSHGNPRRLIIGIGGLDLAAAAAAGALAALGLSRLSIIIGLFYVLRPLAQVLLVREYESRGALAAQVADV